MLSTRLLRWLRGCRHDGPMLHVRMLGPAAELWRCTQCGAELVALDADVADPRSRPERLAA